MPLPAAELNELLRDFCAENGIAMFDLTPALQRAVDTLAVFLHEDTRWDEAGHEMAARAVAKFLQLAP